MEWTDNVSIETPEQIEVSLEIAGLGSRFVACVVDTLYKLLVMLVMGAVGLLLFAALALSVGPSVAIVLAALLALVYLVFSLGYKIYFEVRRNGQTPGKKFAGIRVIRVGGAPVDFTTSAIRNILSLGDMMPPVVGSPLYLIDAFFVLVTKQGQRLGDMAAGTMVIRERLERAPQDVDKLVESRASEEVAFTAPQLAECQPADRHILRSFFQRFPKLAKRSRRDLSLRLAREFMRKTSYEPAGPLDSGEQAVAFLASLYRDLEKLARQGG
jgi:uncharacterized RDD family membrane protein YckC